MMCTAYALLRNDHQTANAFRYYSVQLLMWHDNTSGNITATHGHGELCPWRLYAEVLTASFCSGV